MRYMGVLLLFMTIGFGQNTTTFTQAIDIVVDEKKRLMWQDNDEVMEYFETHVSAEVYCDVLVLSGYTNWRIPTIGELQTIIDLERKNSLQKQFRFVKPVTYRTKSLFVEDDDLVWMVDFQSGKTDTVKKEEKHLIRCVRDMR